MTNDRHYYRDGAEQLWRIVPGEAPRQYTEADGWRPLQIWGMGIASEDLTGDGYPEVFLTSQGDNKLQTLADGPAQPTYEDIALGRGATAHRPFAGGDVLPSTAWHAEFDDVNNDGFVDLFVTKGNVEAQAGYATRDPSNLLIGQADGTFVEGAEAAGIVELRPGARRRARRPQPRRDARPRRRQPPRAGVGVAQRRRRATPSDRSRWATGSPSGSISRRRTSTPSARGSRCGWAIAPSSREVTVGGGHAGGKLGWLHVGLGDADRGRGPGPMARRRGRAVDDGRRRPSS